MYGQTTQQQKKAKLIYFTMSLLVNTLQQTQAREVEDLEKTSRIIGSLHPATGLSGYNIKVGIIDGNFDPNSNTRNFLTHSTKKAFSGKDKEVLARQAQATRLGRDHANHVTSIIHEVAKGTSLRVIDMYNDPAVREASSHNARLIASIDAAIRSKVDFINISQRISPDDDSNGKISRDLKQAFYRARDAGIGIIKSAGNDNEIIGSTPYTRSLTHLLYKMKGSMILVTATAYDSDGQENLAKFSNKAGTAYKYTVSAPGTDIFAYGASKRLIKKSGTSMAAPAVTATAALLKEAYPNLYGSDILKSIRRSTRKISIDYSAYLSEAKYGRGVVNFTAALREAEKINRLKTTY
ncbi:MAG: S8 family serine peptidase [Alphaproteobacteria bacterium]|nr:S8 family serine peptidase [Alphaproteobacteria bacterium]